MVIHTRNIRKAFSNFDSSEDDRDNIATSYQQLSPTNEWHNLYLRNMNWDCGFLAKPDSQTMDKENMRTYLNEEDRVWVKKRIVRKLIGFRWCNTSISKVRKRIHYHEKRI
jgi:hypothetical protein